MGSGGLHEDLTDKGGHLAACGRVRAPKRQQLIRLPRLQVARRGHAFAEVVVELAGMVGVRRHLGEGGLLGGGPSQKLEEGFLGRDLDRDLRLLALLRVGLFCLSHDAVMRGISKQTQAADAVKLRPTTERI